LHALRDKHEVLHQQLAPPLEQIGKRALALGCSEDIVLVNAYPGQRATLMGHLIAQARQLLFAREQHLALGNPFVPGYNPMAFGARLGIAGRTGHVRSHRVGSFRWLSVRVPTVAGG
jgi:hypothetical protein